MDKLSKYFTKLNKALLQSLSGMVFLINPSVEVIKTDYSNLVEKNLIESPFETGNQYFKTPREIDEFFLSTRGIKDKNVKAYFETYKPLMLSASNLFKIPYSFQSCLIFKESRFNKKALSPVGAMGMAQFTEDTYHFMARALRIGKGALEAEGQKMLDVGKFAFVESDSKKLSYSKYNVKIFGEMHRMWQAYLINNELEEIDLGKTSFKRVLYKPEYSIGLSSMYLYYLQHRVKYSTRKYAKEKDFEDPNFILSVAGAYNQGARRVLHALKEDNLKPDFQKWISYQSRVDETKDYISSIRGCMKKVVKKIDVDYVSQRHTDTEKSSFN